MKYKVEKNTLFLIPEDEEDLYKLSKIIEKGDILEGKDFRKVKISNDVIKKQFYIKLKVENIELGKPLRIKGIVLNEHEEFPKGVHHSFTVDIGKEIKLIKKSIPNYIIDLLEEKKKKPINVILIDDEKAEFYILKDKSFEKLKEIKYKISKDKEDQFRDYEKVKGELEKLNWNNFIIGGPGVFKEELAKILKDKKFILASTSYTGSQGIKELLKRDELKKLLEEFKIKNEEEIIERFLIKLKKDENVSYGKDLFELAELGAIEEAYFNSDLVFKNKNQGIEELIKKIEENKGKVHLIESEEAKKKLRSFGDMIAFLRFKI